MHPTPRQANWRQVFDDISFEIMGNWSYYDSAWVVIIVIKIYRYGGVHR